MKFIHEPLSTLVLIVDPVLSSTQETRTFTDRRNWTGPGRIRVADDPGATPSQ